MGLMYMMALMYVVYIKRCIVWKLMYTMAFRFADVCILYIVLYIASLVENKFKKRYCGVGLVRVK